MEAEEGWVPHNTLSAHIVQHEKQLIPGSDPNVPLMKEKCSLCQYRFGPEGGLTLGQYGHSFHILCIQRAAQYSTRCPNCRTPLNARFYEMLGILHSMASGYEFNRLNLPLDQAPHKFQNHLHWGKPMVWLPNEGMHLLYMDPQDKDEYFWMTRDLEVELRAFGIPDNDAREMFCRSMGGHWSTQHQKFFRFPDKEWKKEGPNDPFVEVESDPRITKQYEGYNSNLVGRARILAKLEEVAKVRCMLDLNTKAMIGHKMEEIARAFDKRMDDVITKWRKYLGGEPPIADKGIPAWYYMQSEDKVIQYLEDLVDAALRTLNAHEVELFPKQKNKWRVEEEDDHSPETKRLFERVHMEVQTGEGPSGGEAIPRRKSRRLIAKEGTSRAAEEDSSTEN